MFLVIQVSSADLAAIERPQEKPGDREPANPPQEQKSSEPKSQAPPKGTPGVDQSKVSPPQAAQPERRSFWERLLKMPPLSARIEKSLTQDWKLSDIRPRHIEWLMTDDGEETRRFFMDSVNANQYQRLLKEFKCGFEDRNGRIVDDSFDTLSEYGPELIGSYHILMGNREIIKRYFAGVFRDGRIGTQSLIKISKSMWFDPFEAPKFRRAASLLHSRFQVPDHVAGPMLASVGDSFWLQKVLSRRTAPNDFNQLLNRIAPASSDGSGNAFAPALQLLVLGEENKIPFTALNSFVESLNLKPKDFGPFSAIIFNLGPYKLAGEIKCSTFAQFLRRELDEFGPDITQESARLFLLSFEEFKDHAEALQAVLSPEYQETKAFLRSIGIPIPSTVWNMERIGVLTQTLTPANERGLRKWFVSSPKRSKSRT